MVRKKAKEEVAQNPQPEAKASNRVKKKEVISAPSLKDYEDSPQNKKAVDELVKSLEEQFEASTIKEETSTESEKEEKQKPLHVLADDRLNSLINTANEMGITDIVQILNSDRFGQFYMVYRA